MEEKKRKTILSLQKNGPCSADSGEEMESAVTFATGQSVRPKFLLYVEEQAAKTSSSADFFGLFLFFFHKKSSADI